jgi:hypothetical protein
MQGDRYAAGAQPGLCRPRAARGGWRARSLSWCDGGWLDLGFSSHDLRCGSSLQVRFGSGGRCPAGVQGWHGQGHCQAVLAGAGPDTLETADTGRVGNPPSARWSLPSRRPQSHPMGTTLPRTHRRTSHGPPPANAQRRSPEPGWRAGPSGHCPRAAARRGTRTWPRWRWGSGPCVFLHGHWRLFLACRASGFVRTLHRGVRMVGQSGGPMDRRWRRDGGEIQEHRALGGSHRKTRGGPQAGRQPA